MKRLSITECQYHPDSVRLFTRIRDLPRAVWLDSCYPMSRYGRYDIISASPESVLQTQQCSTLIKSQSRSYHSRENPFDLLKEQLASLSIAEIGDIPFCGGAIGYFGYDLGRTLETLPDQTDADVNVPDMHIALYTWAIIVDHQLQKTWLIKHPRCSESTKKEILQRISSALPPVSGSGNGFTVGQLTSNFTFETYSRKLDHINEYIHAGDCYQVNFAQRYSADYEGDPLYAYLQLRQHLPSPYSAFIDLQDGAVLSFSPERFISVHGKQVETAPIKGTRARGKTQKDDALQIEELKNSIKDQAENLMIVDLLRNDLGKSCIPGSITVPELFSLQSFPNVHHLVSRICGILQQDKDAIDLLKGCFPGGSITGAPKLRAMEIIEELEPTKRSVYCGSIGYMSAEGKMDTNIAIRTLVCDNKRIHCWGGGGIVADSEPLLEYQESLSKIKVILDCLRTMV